MKILKVYIEIEQTDGGTKYIYPQTWLDNKEKFPYIVYPASRGDEVIKDGKSYQPVFVCVPLDLVDMMKAVGCEDTTQAEFEVFSSKHYPVKERITDESAVLAVLSKAVLDKPLTDEDKKVLDPNDPTPGVSMTKSSLEIAADYNVQW